MRKIVFVANSQKTIDKWNTHVSGIAKVNLQALQQFQVSGFSALPDWQPDGKLSDKSLKGGKLKGSRQLTIKDKDSYRVVYIAEYQEAVYVLHAFKKKTEGVDKRAMATIESRLKAVKQYRRRK